MGLLKEQTVFSAAELSLYSTIIIIILKSSSNNILYGTVSFWFQVCLKVFLGPRLLHWNSE